MDIRIGNDIRIDVSLSDHEESDKCYVKRVEAALINCSEQHQHITSYTVNSCGYPEHNVLPVNSVSKHGCGICGKHDTHHGKFNCPCTKFNYEIKHHWYEPCAHYSKRSNKIHVHFPGCDQICGEYKLVLFLFLHDAGYNSYNTRTVVIDFGTVFHLSCKENTEAVGIVTLSCTINGETEIDGKPKDGRNAISIQLTTDSGSLILNTEDKITIHATVFDGREDITDDVTNYDLNWTRISNDAQADLAWNKKHMHQGNTITVNRSDIIRKIVYQCELDPDSTLNKN